ncbi:MAG: hypothetical protein IPH85_04285 [Ignavibacteria bacterium]|nr:hypothetical protein [Ignavibacteria bacterium]
MRTLYLCLFVFATLPIFAAENQPLLTPEKWPASFTGKHAASFYSIDATAFSQARSLADDESIMLSVQLPKLGTVEIKASRFRVIDEQTTITAMTANGPMPVPPPQSVLLRGRIIDIPDSYVILAVYPNWCTGFITTGPLALNRTYRISPLSNGSGKQTMVVYDGADVPSVNDWNCGTLDPTDVHTPSEKNADGPQAVTFRQIKLSIECDEPFYIDHGRDLTKATQYAEAVVAASSAIYERDVTATHTIGSLMVWTTTDPYTSNLPDEMLVQFRDRWRTLNGTVNRSVAHLFSGVNNIGGIAYVDQLCNKQWGYAVVGTNNNVTYPAAGYVWDTDVFSHELGHNVGSPHTHSCTWNPPIDSCYTAEGSCFTGTKATKGTIMSYCHLTAQGTELVFHSRVVTLMKNKLNASACTPLISLFDLTVPASVSVCNGNPTSITATATGGTGRLSYRWRGSLLDTTTQSQTLVIAPAASFKLFITVTDSVGSTITDSTNVTVNAKPLAIINATEDRVCTGTVVEVTSQLTGGRLPYTYRWLKNGTVIDTTSDMVWPRIDSTTSIRLMVTDLNGCSDTSDIVITVPDHRLVLDPPMLVIPPLTVCDASFTSGITLRNDGLETIVIDSLRSGSALAVSTDLPIIIPPASAIVWNVNVSAKATGLIKDSLIFISRLCNTRFKLPVQGSRETLRVMSSLPADLGAKIVCDTPTPRFASIRIDNPSPFPIQVTSVSGKQFGNNISLVNGPVTIPSTSEQAVQITTDIKRLPGVHTDSLTISFVSEGCEGALTIPLTMRVIGLSVDHPNVVSFDTVLTSEASLTRMFTINVSLIGSNKITTQNVRIDEPFTTTMTDGLVLPHGRQTSIGVSIAPSQISIDGEVKGKLRFSLDSCSTERTIDISAIIRTVSVNTEDPLYCPVDPASEFFVYDLRGMLVSHTTGVVQEEIVSGLSRGVYILVNVTAGHRRTQRLICR